MSTRSDNSEDEDDRTDFQEAGETMTPKQLTACVTLAWQNEKLSPELLNPVEYELEALRILVTGIEGNMRKFQATDMRLSIHRMEIKRLRYIMTSYLRIRILKIQEYPWFYALSLEGNRQSILMENEVLFLKEYLGNLESFISDVAIENMPITSRKFTKDQLKKCPNVNKFVFFLSKKNVNFTITDANKDQEVAEIKDGSQYVMRYQPVRKFLQKDEISLI